MSVFFPALLISFLFWAPVGAFSAPSLVRLSTHDKFSVTDLLEEGVKIPKSGLPREMALAKRAYFKEDKANCLRWSRRVGTRSKLIRHWAYALELKCALMGKPRLNDLSAVLGRIKKNPQWLLSAHFAKEIRGPYLSGLIAQARLYSKSQRSKAWLAMDEAFSHKEWLTTDQQAELYALAGEISFVDQSLLAAKDYFLKSLQLKESKELRERLDSILVALNPKGKEAVKANELEFIKGPTASKAEEALYKRMSSAVASRDLISAVEDGVGLLVKFPRGDYASEVEDKVASLFIGMATGPEKNWNQIKSRVLRTLRKAGGDRLLSWAKLSFRRGKYREAFELAESAAEKLEGLELSGEALSLAAQSAHSSGELNLAIKYYREVAEKFSGAPYFFESLFRLGLVYYRKSDYSDAIASFERLLSSNGSENFEYRALYWTWRALQNLKMERAKDLQDLLIQKYPMTLYGMRALAEKSDQVIKLSKSEKPQVVKVNLRLLPDQKLSIDRFKLLIRGGWLEEAKEELKNLPQPQTPEEHLIYSRLFSVARDYVTSIRLMNQAWELNPQYAYQKDYLLWIFPNDFKREIQEWSSKRSLEPVWIKSLVRQESAFNPRAVSRSYALGLMQLLPSTAQEVARDLRLPELKIPDSLFDSETNVELGTTYLKRMLNRYEGQLPFALAAYNAGPTRLSRWLRSGGIEVNGESELWVDELPWSETSYYVKAILRNILIFQILDQGQLKINSPIWAVSS